MDYARLDGGMIQGSLPTNKSPVVWMAFQTALRLFSFILLRTLHRLDERLIQPSYLEWKVLIV